MDIDKELVSIGMPTANRPILFKLALDDIINQTHKKIEIIISDNHPKENETEKLVQEYLKKDCRIKYFRQKTKLSAPQNFSFVLSKAKGTFFAWAADDDRREKNFIEDLLKSFKEYPECSLVHSEPFLLDQHNIKSPIIFKSYINTLGFSKISSVRNVLINQNLNNEIWGVFKTELIKDFIFPPIYGSDHAILLHAALKGPIFKGTPGLLLMRTGGAGWSPERVIEDMGIKRNIFNLYFCYISQSLGLIRYLFKSKYLRFFEKFIIIFIIFERTFFVKLYRDSIKSDFLRLFGKIKKMGRLRVIYHRIKNLPKEIKGRYYNFINHYRVYSAFKKYVYLPKNEIKNFNNIAIVSLEGMNYFMPTIWGIYSTGLKYYGYKAYAITFRNSKLNNKYYRIFGINLIFWDDYLEKNKSVFLDDLEKLNKELFELNDFKGFYNFSYYNFPLGKFGISTYCRNMTVGDVILPDDETKKELIRIIDSTYLNFLCAKKFIDDFNIKKSFFTELNTDSYGGIYKACLEKDVDIIRWATSNRDNAFFLQHINKNFNSVHHSCLSPYVWKKIKDKEFTPKIDEKLDEYFIRRYGGEWKIFSRNFKNTKELDYDQIRSVLKINDNRKNVIIYSHILYDTLYFYGTDLFETYSQWLLETIKVACNNTNVRWFIKLHPSNIWRGEKAPGEYTEEVLINKFINPLPEHIRFIGPDTPISPLSWMRFADFGITVRGTAGLEMACLGKPVITAGTGRYEGVGFTIDSDTKEEYFEKLLKLPLGINFSEEQRNLARKYAYAVFIGKIFDFKCLDAILGAGKKEVRQYNDLLFVPSKKIKNINPKEWEDLKKLGSWLSDIEKNDYFRWELFDSNER